ncbi:MAG: tetratricopeptide repeat protein [Candidatus Cloacimonetes bacterium]|nr:tetratricopeptide repeat protein [Candidatus Cloacimonadota bacterium]
MFNEFDDLTFKELFKKKPKYQKIILKEGERKQVSIMFADLSGFTAMSQLLDTEEAQSLTDRILQIFTKCIEYYGGYIDKYEGDLVMALFGAKKASERDTERAISAGLLMLDQLKKINHMLQNGQKKTTINLSVRIGINTGLVTTGKVGKKREGDFTVYGTPVNIASRMESNAPLNTIMIPKRTMEIVKDNFNFLDNNEIMVKGIDHPIQVFIVKGYKKERIQRWQVRYSPFVGRNYEIEKMEKIYKQIKNSLTKLEKPTQSQPYIIGINAEAGMGKSRLTYEFSKNKEDTILYGTTPKLSQKPFALFTSMIQKYLQIYKTDSLEVRKDKFDDGINHFKKNISRKAFRDLNNEIPLIGTLLHIKYDDPRIEDDKNLYKYFQNAIFSFIKAVAESYYAKKIPLLLILEDLHWLDESSKKMINFFLQSFESGDQLEFSQHLMFIFIYRSMYNIPDLVSRNKNFSEIILKPLSNDQCSVIVSKMTENIDIRDKVIAKVLKMSNGNPFYIEEWCNLVQDIQEINENKELPIPHSLNALILTRIDHLEKNMRLLLQKAAVIGKEFFTSVLSEVEKKLEQSLKITDLLNQLENNEYVRRILGFKYSKYFFKHILTHEVAYRTILKSNRKILHKVVAEVIEEHFAGHLEDFYYELSNHYIKAQINNKAIEYTIKAADLSKLNFDNLRAIQLYDLAIELLTEQKRTESIIETNFKKMEILLLISKLNEVDSLGKEMLKQSKELNDFKFILASLKYLSHVCLYRGNLNEAYQLFLKRLEIAEGIDDEYEVMAAKGNIGVYYMLTNKFDKSVKYFQESLTIAEMVQNKLQIVKCNINLGLVKIKKRKYEEAKEFFETSLKISERYGFKVEQHKAIGNIGLIHLNKKEHQKALISFEKKLELTKDIQDMKEIAFTYGYIGNCYLDLDNYAKAIHHFKKAKSLKETMNDKRGVAISIFNISKMYFYLENHKIAYENCMSAFKLIKNMNNISFIFLMLKFRILYKLEEFILAKEAIIVSQKFLKYIKDDFAKYEVDFYISKVDDKINNTATVDIIHRLKSTLAENNYFKNELPQKKNKSSYSE